jgi:hypothetical protein
VFFGLLISGIVWFLHVARPFVCFFCFLISGIVWFLHVARPSVHIHVCALPICLCGTCHVTKMTLDIFIKLLE